MVTTVRVLSVLAASNWLTPILPGSAVMCMASSGRGVKKRRLDVPNIAFLDAGILFDILGYSRFDCLHVCIEV
jgi:hypothetical protein